MNKDDKLTKREKHLHSHMIASRRVAIHASEAQFLGSRDGVGVCVCVSKGSGEGCSDLSARTPRE